MADFLLIILKRIIKLEINKINEGLWFKQEILGGIAWSNVIDHYSLLSST